MSGSLSVNQFMLTALIYLNLQYGFQFAASAILFQTHVPMHLGYSGDHFIWHGNIVDLLLAATPNSMLRGHLV